MLEKTLESPLDSKEIHPVQFSRSVMPDSLRSHESQCTRPPCPSPTPRAYSNSCPLHQWCHPINSSSAIPFPSPSIFPSIKIFPSELAVHISGQSIGASALALVLPMNIQHWFPSGLAGLINKLTGLSLAVQGTLKSLLQHHSLKASILTLFSLL